MDEEWRGFELRISRPLAAHIYTGGIWRQAQWTLAANSASLRTKAAANSASNKGNRD